MIHLKIVQESEELLNKIIEQWGAEVWHSPSTPRTQEQRRVRHEELANRLIENNFSPECISLKHIDAILKITIPFDSGSKACQQMRGAAYWYLSTALNKSDKKSNPTINVVLLRKTAA